MIKPTCIHSGRWNKTLRYEIRLFVFSILFFGLMSYWGTRAPDSEIVFRVTQSLADHGTYEVPEPLAWKGFGIAEGHDGKNYSIFGPGQSVVALGFYKIAEIINKTEWYKKYPRLVGKSHYFNGGVVDFVNGYQVTNPDQHALRSLMGWFNVLVGASCLLVFFRIIKCITGSDDAALLSAIFFGFGSLFFPYTGTFFSEPLAILFELLSFYCLLRCCNKLPLQTGLWLACAGLMLGFAILTHITAILCVPFFLVLGLYYSFQKQPFSTSKLFIYSCVFGIALFVCLTALGYYNYIRFGSWLETGRRVEGAFRYGEWTTPWHGLKGLLFSAGKGLIFYCPSILICFYFWKKFHAKYKLCSMMILSAFIFRLLFISMRSDWSGGLCLGPRYLIMFIPFLFIPVGVALAELIKTGRWKHIIGVGIASFLCVSQQLYFALGDVYSYWRCSGNLNGVNLFHKDLIYETWEVSPLFHLMSGLRGSLLLSLSPLSNWMLLLSLMTLMGLLFLLVYRPIIMRTKEQEAPSPPKEKV